MLTMVYSDVVLGVVGAIDLQSLLRDIVISACGVYIGFSRIPGF